MPQEPITITIRVEIEKEQGDGRECGHCGVLCAGESSTLYFTAPIRQRLATLCYVCSAAWEEWRKTHDF